MHKNVLYNFPEPEVASLNCFSFLSKEQSNISYHQRRLRKPRNIHIFLHFCLINSKSINWLINRLIVSALTECRSYEEWEYEAVILDTAMVSPALSKDMIPHWLPTNKHSQFFPETHIKSSGTPSSCAIHISVAWMWIVVCKIRTKL